ncbi:LysM peptidoglycan-binding domain-containing protein [Puniceibacterium sp. IMCC21224]|uniref:LysM peptidoglycan-binding domain-containing protein n=1 Tax=Puniceibacterium sp. IMCC21224 TaxID=1618204 RepID=UPI00065DB375|nr:LysM peptidoglycan-binding domain-containing protein [Puniceibacterium sp. IMCC21224]KMK67942.1 uncharacterized protein containing LysM domain [Puniceibacterium sp. IMCC21224]
MSKGGLASGTTGLALGGLAAVGLVAVALLVSGRMSTAPGANSGVASVTQGSNDAAVPADDPPAGEASLQSTATTPPELNVDAATSTNVPMAAAPAPPTFDLVRVEADGTTLVAGIAEAQSDVEILVDDQIAAAAVSDGTGKFVGFLTLAPSAAARKLSLVMRIGGVRTQSEDTVLIAPTLGTQIASALQNGSDPSNPEVAPATVAQSPSEVSVTFPMVAADVAQVVVVTDDAVAAPSVVRGASDPVGVETSYVVDQGAAEIETAQDRFEPNAGADGIAMIADQVDTASTPPPEEAGEEASGLASAQPDAAAPDGKIPTALAAVTAATSAAQSGGSAAATAEIAEITRPAPIAPAPQPAAAPTVILSSRAGIEVLQAPAPTADVPEALTDVALDAITYEDDGNVILTGRGRGAAQVRIYLDNAPVTTSRIRADGRWRVALPDVATGIYTLRVDQLRDDGSVGARVESPFKREEVAVLAAVAALSDGVAAQAVTVQPGHTLWAIARDRYGEGIAYVRVFDANRGSIRNPDLIYPGQVFALPEP